MKTFQMNTRSEVLEAEGELRVLWGDGRWLALSETVALPIPPKAEFPGDAILQLVRRAKNGPITLETVLDAVRRQWNNAA